MIDQSCSFYKHYDEVKGSAKYIFKNFKYKKLKLKIIANEKWLYSVDIEMSV